MDLTELTLVSLIYDPKLRKVSEVRVGKDKMYLAMKSLEKAQQEGKWIVGKFVIVEKTGEYAGNW